MAVTRSLTVTDDRLALAADRRDLELNRLDTGLERHVYRCALDAQGGALDRTGLCCIDGALAVRSACPARQRRGPALPHRPGPPRCASCASVALTDILVGTRDNGADGSSSGCRRPYTPPGNSNAHPTCSSPDHGYARYVAYGDDRTDVRSADLALVVHDIMIILLISSGRNSIKSPTSLRNGIGQPCGVSLMRCAGCVELLVHLDNDAADDLGIDRRFERPACQ